MDWLKRILENGIIKSISLIFRKKDKHIQNQTQKQSGDESKVELGVEIKLGEGKTKSDNTSTPKEEKKENQPGGQTKSLVQKQKDYNKGWNRQIPTWLVLAFWLLVWAIVAIPATWKMDWPDFSKWVTGLIILSSGTLTAFLGYYLTYELAKKSIFVTMTPEMSAIAITYWKKLKRFYLAVSEENKSYFFERLCELKNQECGYKKFIFLKPGKGGLCVVGVPPANKIHEWTETTNGEETKRALSLAETTIIFPMQKRKKGDSDDKWDKETDTEFVPNVNTKDGIEVSASFTLYFWVLDPEKGLFGVKNRTSALAELAFAAWRKVVGDLKYYSEEEVKDKKSEEATKNTAKGKKDSDNEANNSQKPVIEIDNEKKFVLNSEILEEAGRKLQEELGLIKESESNNKIAKDHHGASKKAIKGAKTVDNLLKLMIGNRNPKGTAVRIFLRDWGMLLREIAITDLEPTDADVRESIKNILKAEVGAKKEITEAKGTSEATKLKGEGEAGAIEAKAAAYAKDGGNFVAAGDIAANLPKNTTLVSGDVRNLMGALAGKFFSDKGKEE